MLKESKDPIKKSRETYKESLLFQKKYYEQGTDFGEATEDEIRKSEAEIVVVHPGYRAEVDAKWDDKEGFESPRTATLQHVMTEVSEKSNFE